MAKQASTTAEQPGIVARVKEFIEEIQVELGKVSWPSWEDIKSSTQVVLFMLVVFAVLCFVYDNIFQWVILTLIDILG